MTASTSSRLSQFRARKRRRNTEGLRPSESRRPRPARSRHKATRQRCRRWKNCNLACPAHHAHFRLRPRASQKSAARGTSETPRVTRLIWAWGIGRTQSLSGLQNNHICRPPRRRGPYSRVMVIGPRLRGDDRDLEQTQLLGFTPRVAGNVRWSVCCCSLVETEPVTGCFEAPADQPCIEAHRRSCACRRSES